MVEILIVTWNGRRVLPACLAALRRHTSLPHRIIVWDNGSGDGTFQYLARQKDLVVFRSKKNLGIAAGCNAILRRARSPIVVRLDDDTLVPPRWLERLLQPMRDPSVAMVGCKFITPGGQLRATEFIPPFFPSPLGKDGPPWSYSRSVEAVGGPCCALRLDAVRSLGGYSEAVSDQEDVDICLRLRLKGYKIFYVGGVAVINKALNRRRKEFVEQNRAKFWKRWSGFAGFPRKDSHPIDRHYLAAWRLYRQGKFRQVLKQLQPIADSPLREYGVQFLTALAYRRLGKIAPARKSLRDLVKARSRTGLLAESAWAMDQRDWAAAQKAVLEGLRCFPKDPSFLFYRGRLKRRQGLSWEGGYREVLKNLSEASPAKNATDRLLGLPGIDL